jgi:hypothetical protein
MRKKQIVALAISAFFIGPLNAEESLVEKAAEAGKVLEQAAEDAGKTIEHGAEATGETIENTSKK